MRLMRRLVALVGDRPTAPIARPAGTDLRAPRPLAAPPTIPAPAHAPGDGPGATTADATDPCEPARTAVGDACALADRMNALALAAQDRLRVARRAYDEHADRRRRAAEAADPRAVRTAKDEAQAAFRRTRLAAAAPAALESAAREWLREVDRINARSREAARTIAREDAQEAALLKAVESHGLEADGARIAAESAAEACRNARIALATCEEGERLGNAVPGAAATSAGWGLAPATVEARVAPAPVPPTGDSAAVAEGAGGAGATAVPPTAAGSAAQAAQRDEAVPPELAPRQRPHLPGEEAPPEHAPRERPAVPAIVPLLAGDRAVMRRIVATLAETDAGSETKWQIGLAGLVDAVMARAVDSAALTFPEDHPFWGPFTQVQCREIAAALAALGYRYDGAGSFADTRIPSQRDLSLAIGYAGLDPMRIRIWPTEAEMPHLYEDVRIDAAGFLSGAAGELTLGDMIDLLGRRAEDLSDLWNAWGRIRPLLLAPA